MPVKIDDKNKTRNIVLTRSCVVNGAAHTKGTKLTVPLTDGNFLVAVKKAVDAKDYVEPKPEPKGDKK